MAIRVVEGIRLQMVPARRLFETMSLKPEIMEKPDALSMPGFGGPIRTEKMSFGYIPEQDVLRDLSVQFPKFRRTAIVGPSGSGKTSLINLLLRFYDPNRGSVRADQIDLRDVALGSYYRNFGIVFQEDFLFSGTIRENIRYGKPDATQEEIEQAARESSVHNDIADLPKGYDTDIGEGTKLSGGQRQRIAIARALIRKPSILVFDEATHSLDSLAASEIERSMNDLSRKRTVIVITHRLTSIAGFDEIVVLEGGKIREKGTFNDLRRKKGRFYRLLEEQKRLENAEKP
jgi:ATP-binding cassette subfamily B protein